MGSNQNGMYPEEKGIPEYKKNNDKDRQKYVNKTRLTIMGKRKNWMDPK